MGFYRGPQIVTSGLVLHLDAANPKSYTTTGTTWSDLSGNRNNGTLTNGPSFSSANMGSIGFDGVNDYVSIPSSTSLTIEGTGLTLGAWINYNLTQEDWKGVIYKASGNSTGFQLFIDSSERIAFGIITTTGFARPNSGVYLSPNTWHYIVGTYDGVNMRIYEDTILRTTFAKTGTIVNANVNLDIGRSFSTEEMPGNISQVQIYNRALSATEVLQNFNAIKSRYGL
jgi:hypothetical protein